METVLCGMSCRNGRGLWWFALFPLGASLLFGAARAATVVTAHVVSGTKHTQTSVPVTFGQIFKAGDVAKGESVVATLNGQSVPLQVDVKATNPDGSLRHAVLTALIPTVAGGSSEALAISTAPRSVSGAPLTVAQLLATKYDATASLDIGGKNYTVNARTLLQAANAASACKSWGARCNVWLSGPLTSEWVVSGPVTSADGIPNPNLKVYFAIRVYAGATAGTVGQVRTDVIVENASAYTPQAQPQYTATVTSGSASYTTPALTQYAYTRWHKLLWWNNAQPQVYLQQDTQYLQSSLAVSRYMNLKPDEKFLASRRQTCAPLDHCDQTLAMGNAGAQDAIGPLPRWTSVYIVHPDVRAYHWMLANTDALGTYPVHYRDQTTGWPLSIQKHPYATIDDWSWANQAARSPSATGQKYKLDLLPNCINNPVVTSCKPGSYGTGNPYSWSNAHQPAAGYVAYMVTGSYYYMEEMAYYASISELTANETYRGFSQGLIDPARSQVRGKAWVLREMVDAAWLLPDGYPLKAEFNADVNNSIANFNATYTHNPAASPLGLMNSGSMYSMNGGTHNGGTPWQHNFLIWSVGHATELGFVGAAEFRNWLAKFEIGLMTDWQTHPTQGYCWLEASTYSVQVKDTSGNWLPTYTAVYAATFPDLVGLTCNSAAMVAAMGKQAKRSWRIGEMKGYATSATGFPANFQIGIAAAANSGLPNAQTAWHIFEGRSVKPSGSTAYNNYPNFAVLPR